MPEPDIIFLPTIENHLSNFLPVLHSLKQVAIYGTIIKVDEAIIGNRSFELDFNSIEERTIAGLDSWIASFNKKNKLLVVGNDSEPMVCAIIRKFKKAGIPVVLFQDGWLDARNIRKPIYTESNAFTPLKKFLHHVLTSKFLPTKHYFHNFIGQNADYFFVYSSIAKNEFIKAKVNENQIFIVGSPRHLALRDLISSENPKESAVVLFSTVTGTEEDLQAVMESISWLKEVYSTRKIVIKLHPNESKDKYTSICSQQIKVLGSSIADVLHDYNISIAFCFASTVVLDMLILNIPIIQLITPHLKKTYTNYYFELPLASTAEEIKSLDRNYDLKSVQKIASNYLIDVDPDQNSILLSVEAVQTILKK